MRMAMVSFKRGVKPNDLSSLDGDTLYFFSDTQEIFLGPANYAESITALGFSLDGTSFHVPATVKPTSMGKGTVLVTEGAGATVGNKSLSVSTGMNVTCNSAEAGATQYSVKNTYINRIVCSLALGGMACLNENDAKNTVKITSITVNGVTVSPTSTASTYPIIITVEKSINPDSSTTVIRIYPPQKGFSNIFSGVAGCNSDSAGYSLVAGQNVYNAANASAVLGNSLYNKGNSSLLAGRQHINTKMNACLIGCGHDSTQGNNGVAAFGNYSNITSRTLLAVGNGTISNDNTTITRKNAFEVTSDGIILNSPNGSKFLISVDDNGSLVTSATT